MTGFQKSGGPTHALLQAEEMIRSDAPCLVADCVPQREVAGQQLPHGPSTDDPAQSVASDADIVKRQLPAGDAVRLVLGSYPRGLGGQHRID